MREGGITQVQLLILRKKMAVASPRREHGLLLLNQWTIEEEHATQVFRRRFRARPYFSCFPPTLLVSSLHSIVNELKGFFIRPARHHFAFFALPVACATH